MGIKHDFTSGKSDSADTTLVNPSNWNADHTIDGDITPASSDGAALGTTALEWSDLFLASGGVINWNNGAATITEGSGDLTFDVNALYTWQVNSSVEMYLGATALTPGNNNGLGLGTSSFAWSDLFLADGGVIDWGNGLAELRNLTDFEGKGFGETLELDFGAASYPALTAKTTDTGGFSIIPYTTFNGDSEPFAIYPYFQTTTAVVFNAGSFHCDVSSNTNGSEETRWRMRWVDAGAYKEVRFIDSTIRPVSDDTLALGQSGTAWSDLYLADGGVVDFNSGETQLAHQTDGNFNVEFGTKSYPGLQLKNTTSASGGPYLRLIHEGIATGSIYMGISFQADDDAGVLNNYVDFQPYSSDATAGSEDGVMRMRVCKAGNISNDVAFILSGDLVGYGGASGNAHIHMGGNNYTVFQITGDTALSGGPGLILRHNTSSPAASDDVGYIDFTSEDSASNIERYGAVSCKISDPTSASEDGLVRVRADSATHGDPQFDIGVPPAAFIGGTYAQLESDTSFGNFEIVSTADGSGGSYMSLHHDSASPADNDYIGGLSFRFENDVGTTRRPAVLETRIQDVTDGTEDTIAQWIPINSGSASGQGIAWGNDPFSLTSVLSANPSWYIDGGDVSYTALYFVSEANSTGGAFYNVLNDWDKNGTWPGGVETGMVLASTDSAGNYVNVAGFAASYTDETNGTEDSIVYLQGQVNGSIRTPLEIGNGAKTEGSPTGSYKGSGTINAKAVYDDNTLLTCYVDDAAKTGKVDIAKWDAFADPDGAEDPFDPSDQRRHWGARKFAERLGTEYDPTKFACQKKHLEDKRHLTCYPNPEKYSERTRPSIGGWVQRGVEMDELLFQYITELESRLAALETNHA